MQHYLLRYDCYEPEKKSTQSGISAKLIEDMALGLTSEDKLYQKRMPQFISLSFSSEKYCECRENI